MSAAPTATSPTNSSPGGEGAGNRDGGDNNMQSTPEWVSRAPTRSSLSSANATLGAPGTSSVKSRKSCKGAELECTDAESEAMSDTEDHQLLLQQPSSSTDISGLTSSLLLHELSTISSGAGTSRAAVRGSAGGSIVASGFASISSQTLTTVVPEVAKGSIGALSSYRQVEQQLSSNTISVVAVDTSTAPAPTVTALAGVSAVAPSCFSKKGQSVSNSGHPLHQSSSFWAGAASLVSSATLLSESARRFSAPLPLSSSSTRVGHEGASGASATAAVACVLAEDRPESAEAAAGPIEAVPAAVEEERQESADTLGDAVERGAAASATAAAPTVAQGRQEEDDGGRDAAPPRWASDDSESSAVGATTKNVHRRMDDRRDTCARVTAAQSSALSTRRGAGSSYAPTAGCPPAEGSVWREKAAQAVSVDDSRSWNWGLFSPTASLNVRVAPHAASDTEGCSCQSDRTGNAGDCSSGTRSKGARIQDGLGKLRPSNGRSSDLHGAVRRKDADVGCITMSSLVAHVAVPPTVQAVLRNPDATKEELWVALRTACQQCEVLQRRLARAEGALGSEEESEAAEGDEKVICECDALTNVKAPQYWSDNANKTLKTTSHTNADEDDTNAANGVSTVEGASRAESGTALAHISSAPMRSSPALPARARADCQCDPEHRVLRPKAGLAVTATAPRPVCATSCGNSSSIAHNPHFRRGGSSSDASSVLRDRVSELIRRVEAERKAQPHPPHARHSPERHVRPDSSGLDGPTSSRDADDATSNSKDRPCYVSPPSPLPESHRNRRSTPPPHEQTARAPQKPRRIESGSPYRFASACAAWSHVSNSGGAGSVGEAVAAPSSGIFAPPALPAIAGVEAQTPVARRSANSHERARLVQSPRRQQQQLHRRLRGASSASLASDPTMVDENVCSNGPVAAAESLTGLPATAGSLSGSPRADCIHIVPNTTQYQAGLAAPTSVSSASAAVFPSMVTSLSGTLPSLQSSTITGRPTHLLSPLLSGASISSVESARVRQPQQQQAVAKATVPRAAIWRAPDDTVQQETPTSPRSRSPNLAGLSPTSAALEMLRQLQQDDAPVPPVTRDDQKAALRQWRREAAVMKAKGAAPMC
ncbi:hypothetical protein LSCM1_07830 [Leishmania martiniquensis]|uniref:Uncharacterized protein n=1 Tax=Leishmania martiniquensis TaxID=1580590 RepID=A0A836KRR2_9TRYP|nr:hypothetical protein LSCM1_07830 [Leishmania martiniquensis]